MGRNGNAVLGMGTTGIGTMHTSASAHWRPGEWGFPPEIHS